MFWAKMSASTTGQPPQEVFAPPGDQWTQENCSANVQNETNSKWNSVPNHNIVAVPTNSTNSGYIPNAANRNIPIEYSPTLNYINVPSSDFYHRQANINTGYPPMGSIPNAQNFPTGPIFIHAPQIRPAVPNTWPPQQNIKLIQTAWNKSSSPGIKKQKRVRTAFTSHQMMELEQEYVRTRYLDRSRRIELAEMLRLNERTIKIWFQNRRMKEKKDRMESLEEAMDDVSTTQPPALGIPEIHESYQANSESYEKVGVFIEQEYPVSSTTMPMSSMPPAFIAPDSYPTYAIPEESPAQYQQVHCQVAHYPSYGEVQELSPESTPQSESSASVDTAPSDVAEQNWDLSWIRSIQPEDE